jgi:tRNA-dihydrouridine synthase
LIEKPALADEIIRAAKEGADGVPVSVKTRVGFGSIKTDDWCGFLLEHDIAALTVHGRLAKQTYSIPADWQEIAKVVALRDRLSAETLIIGNGDVAGATQIPGLHSEFNVDGVMIGRGVLHDPFAFGKPGSERFADLSPGEKAGLLKEHLLLHLKTWGAEKTVHVFKKYVKTYISNFKDATRVRAELLGAKSSEEMLESVTAFIETEGADT